MPGTYTLDELEAQDAAAKAAARAGRISLDTFDAIRILEGGEADEEQAIEAMQSLIDSGIVWQLQGCYGRAAIRALTPPPDLAERVKQEGGR